MIRSLLLVGLGGGLGSIARYAVYRLLPVTAFPWGTFIVNLTGSLIIGLCWGLATRNLITEDWRLFLITGICGGFTTFSAFSLESIQLLQENKTSIFVVYVVASVLICLLATFAGLKLVTILK